MTHIHDRDILRAAQDIQSAFEFSLTSASSLPEIAEHAREALADLGHRNIRQSAALLVAKQAKALWLERIMATKKAIANS